MNIDDNHVDAVVMVEEAATAVVSFPSPTSAAAEASFSTSSTSRSRNKDLLTWWKRMDWIAKCTMFMTALVLAGTVVLVVLSVRKHPKDAISDHAPSRSNQKLSSPLSPEDYYNLLFHHFWMERKLLGLRNPSTPVYEALEWMAFQDGAEHQLLLLPQQQQLNIAAVEQRFAVAVLFHATAGPNFWDANWLAPGLSECGFDGVECTDQGVVTHLNLHQRSLLGTLPEELSWLSSLKVLDLQYNRLVGSLPSVFFTAWTQLESINLQWNQMTGTLPSDWSAMTRLRAVRLNGNQFTGSLPHRLPLQTLESLMVTVNPLTGTLPIREWTQSLEELPQDDDRHGDLHSRRLPPVDSDDDEHTIGNITDLLLQEGDEHDDWNETIVAPSTPPTLLPLLPSKLKLLDVSQTQLSGTISYGLPRLFPELKSISLFETNTIGTIPTDWGGWTGLEQISLSSTRLSGTLPTELYSLTQLLFFVLHRTKLEGQLQGDLLHNWSNLQIFNALDSQLTGTIPTQIGYLTDLENFQISYNAISGTIPTELGQLSKLSKLWIHRTKLEGTLSAQICELPFVRQDMRVDCRGNAPITCDCCAYCY